MTAIIRRFILLTAVSIVFLLPTALRAAAGEDAGKVVSIPQLSSAPPVDGTFGGSWNEAAKFHLAYEATYRRAASEDTTVRIGAYHRIVYVAFVAQQLESLIATQVADGPGVLTGDAVMVHLWPNGLSGMRIGLQPTCTVRATNTRVKILHTRQYGVRTVAELPMGTSQFCRFR